MLSIESRQFEASKYSEIAAKTRQRPGYQSDISVRVLEAGEMRHMILDRGQRVEGQSEAGAPWNVIDQKWPFCACGQFGEIRSHPTLRRRRIEGRHNEDRVRACFVESIDQCRSRFK